MEEDEELAQMRKRRLEGAQGEDGRRRAMENAQAEDEQRKLLSAALEPEAYSRLMNVAMSSPKFYQAVVGMIMQLAQGGQLRSRISELQLKALLAKLAARRPAGSISIRRK